MTICQHRHSIQRRVALSAAHRTALYHRVRPFNRTPSATAAVKSALSSHHIDNHIEGKSYQTENETIYIFFLIFISIPMQQQTIKVSVQ